MPLVHPKAIKLNVFVSESIAVTPFRLSTTDEYAAVMLPLDLSQCLSCHCCCLPWSLRAHHWQGGLQHLLQLHTHHQLCKSTYVRDRRCGPFNCTKTCTSLKQTSPWNMGKLQNQSILKMMASLSQQVPLARSYHTSALSIVPVQQKHL